MVTQSKKINYERDIKDKEFVNLLFDKTKIKIKINKIAVGHRKVKIGIIPRCINKLTNLRILSLVERVVDISNLFLKKEGFIVIKIFWLWMSFYFY